MLILFFLEFRAEPQCCRHSKMISKDTPKPLLAFCDRFINSGDDVTLAHLFDALNMAIPDADSQDRYPIYQIQQ
jgi:hypothetical protein